MLGTELASASADCRDDDSVSLCASAVTCKGPFETDTEGDLFFSTFILPQKHARRRWPSGWSRDSAWRGLCADGRLPQSGDRKWEHGAPGRSPERPRHSEGAARNRESGSGPAREVSGPPAGCQARPTGKGRSFRLVPGRLDVRVRTPTSRHIQQRPGVGPRPAG